MQRMSPEVSKKEEQAEQKTAATEQANPVDGLALMGGMMGAMVGIAKETESEEFKAQMEKDPIGSAFGLLFRMMGGMVESMEKAANDAEKKVTAEPAKEAEVKPAAKSPSLTDVGMYRSPALTRDIDRQPEAAPSSPTLRN